MEISGTQIAVLVAIACGTGWLGYREFKPEESEKVANMPSGGRRTKRFKKK